MKSRCLRQSVFVLAVAGALCGAARAGDRYIDLRPHWDETTPLINPHKGWYHHFPDNHIRKYEIAKDADLLEFPGMDHLYIRLAWAYLEPRENQFNWAIIDDLIQKWTGHGLGIAFRISCRETSTDRIEQQFATPRWVMEAGAQGGHYLRGKQTGPEGPWEPVFDDPVFLVKLEHFLAAFAARYDGKPWLRYVDIGSVGDWGEGHTYSGSRREYGYEALKRHVDLHLKYFTKSQLVVSDDFVYSLRDAQDRQRLHRYVVEHGISYRDDSILVDGYLAGHSGTFTVRSPEFFADAYLKTPTVLELEHYGAVKRAGNWDARPGSSLAKHGSGRTGPDFFRGALDLLRATYIGYHGYAAEWLADNPKLTGELLNRCGYWYFLHRVTVPDVIEAGQPATLEMEWQNRGVAPAYHAYRLHLRLEGPQMLDLDLESRNQAWVPSADGKTFRERYRMDLPTSLKPGQYALRFKLRSPQTGRDVAVALQPELRDAAHYYRLGTVELRQPSTGQPAQQRPAKPREWTRQGELGDAPRRVAENLPLSDQSDRGRWERFAPMWDEFEGPSLDTNKWIVGMHWWRGRQPAWFNPDNVTVRGGQLHLTMRREKVPEQFERLGYTNYTSAALHTRARSSYGYYEVKARPMNSGGSSSFWFQQEDPQTHPGWATEIDVFELCGKSPKFERKYHMTVHVFRTPEEKRHWQAGGAWEAPWRFADGFHVYGFEWRRDELRWYVDGVLVRTVENTHWHQPLFLIFDSETMPEWFGMPDDQDLPSTFSVEYVRAWRPKDAR